jgi:hypothetical protein
VYGRIVWAVLLLAIAAWEGFTLLKQDPAYPTFGDVIRFFLRPRLGRWVMFALWAGMGWHFFIATSP